MQFITDYSALTNWLPIVFLALAASMMIVALYYMVGVVINSKKMRDTAIYEFGQAIGTGIIVVIVLAAIVFASTIFIAMIPQATMQSICSTLGGSQVNLLNSQFTNIGFDFGTSSSFAPYNSPTQVICNNIIKSTGTGTDITANLDYGLGAVYAIEANVTNQSIGNMNSLYIFSNWIGFLGSFSAGSELCGPDDCVGGGAPALRITYAYLPLYGYSFISSGAITPLQTQSIFMFEMDMMQLILVTLMLYAWPFLLAGGLILRATIYGRRIGGLLFAIAITAVIIYPTIFMFEYSALSSNSLSPIGIPSNQIPATFSNGISTNFLGTSTTSNSFSDLNINELPTNYAPANVQDIAVVYQQNSANSVTYKFNAFVYPKLDEVINYDGCWPQTWEGVGTLDPGHVTTSGILLASEGSFAAFYLIPLAGAGVGLGNLFGTGLGYVTSVPYVPTTCTPAQAMQTFFDIINTYAVMSVEGVILPLINILIALVAVKGLSSLIGGDTDIVGLGKLV